MIKTCLYVSLENLNKLIYYTILISEQQSTLRYGLSVITEPQR